jgi:hypothetical protein
MNMTSKETKQIQYVPRIAKVSTQVKDQYFQKIPRFQKRVHHQNDICHSFHLIIINM